jgi:hypothetical protein
MTTPPSTPPAEGQGQPPAGASGTHDPGAILGALDGLRASLQQLVSGRRPPADDPGDDLETPRVPRERLRAAEQRAAAAEAKLAEVVGSLDGIKGQFAQTLAGLADAHAADRDLIRAGVDDDDGRAAVRAAWERQPKADRGRSPAEWWAKQAADPESAKKALPRTLHAYLPAAAPAAAAAAAKGSPANPLAGVFGRPAVDAGTAPASPAGVEPVRGKGLDAYFASLDYGTKR